MSLALVALPGDPTSTAYGTDATLLSLLAPHLTAYTRAVQANTDGRARAGIVARQRLDTEQFAGQKADPAQAFQWPRSGVWDADAGAVIPSTVYPDRLVLAWAELTAVLLDTAVGVLDAPAIDAPDPSRDIASTDIGGEIKTQYIPAPLRLASDDLERWPRVWRPLKPLLAAHAPSVPVAAAVYGDDCAPAVLAPRYAVIRSLR